MFMPEMITISTDYAKSLRTAACPAAYRKLSDGRKKSECRQKVFSSMDPRLEQLIVYSSVLEHLLQQKQHYEHEHDMELHRLERFKREGAKEIHIKVQLRVVKKVQGMLPGIVFKMRNEYDKFERFMHREQGIKDLDVELYDKAWELLITCRQTLK